jgi:hypothetical protein
VIERAVIDDDLFDVAQIDADLHDVVDGLVDEGSWVASNIITPWGVVSEYTAT